MKKIQALVISGYGINCEREMAAAAEFAGATASICHLQTLLDTPQLLNDYQWVLIPGGFSFGDELGGGKVFSNRMATAGLKEALQALVNRGGSIFGVCNGFQILLKLGLLPGGRDAHSISLTGNDSGRFENRWVQHRAHPSHCIYTAGLGSLYLPIRHGEGKLVITDPELKKELFANGQVVLQYADADGKATETYPDNPNGSDDAIAGICDPTGRIFGMMAHPEAFVHMQQHPQWTRLSERSGSGEGLELFKNAVKQLSETSNDPDQDSNPVRMRQEPDTSLCAGAT